MTFNEKSRWIARAARSTCANDKDAAIAHLADLLAWLTSTDAWDREFAKERVRKLVKKSQEEANAE